MFPILKSLLSFVTGQNSSPLSNTCDNVEDNSSCGESDDDTILVRKFRRKAKKLEKIEDDSWAIDRLQEEVNAIEGWVEEVKELQAIEEKERVTDKLNDGDGDSQTSYKIQDKVKSNFTKSIVSDSKSEIESSMCKVGPELCEHRVGTITKLLKTYAIIDQELRFDYQKMKFENVREGDRVNYVVFRKTVEEAWQIHKVLANADENWEETKKEMKTEVLKKTGALERKVIGQVESIKGREVFVKPGIKFCLDDVELDFIPCKGDWLSINALVELDESVQDFVGDVLAVSRIEALRTKVIYGIITYWDENRKEGIVDKNVWFTQTECEPGFVPSLECSVVLQAIESTQGACAWRAVNIVSPLKNGGNESNLQTDMKEKSHKIKYSAAPVCIRNGISIPRNIDIGCVVFGEVKERTIEVSNLGKDHHLLLRGRFHGKKSESQIVLLSRIDDGTIIAPGQKINCRFRINGKFFGQSTEVFVFTFKGFKMTCHIHVEVQDKSLSDLIVQNTHKSWNYRNTYTAARRMQLERRNENLMKGVQPSKPPAFVPVKFSAYSVPEYLWKAVLGEDDIELTSAKIISRLAEAVPCLNKELTITNYSSRFHALLYVEEIDLNIQMHKYDMEGVVMSFVGGEFLSLEVPGLAERRPSLMVGDRVNVVCASQTGYKYEGFVHKVCASEVWLKFHPLFHQTYTSDVCSVHFVASRVPLKRCHISVDLALKHLGEHVLFPKCVKVREPQVNLLEDSKGESVANVLNHNFGHLKSRRLHHVSSHVHNVKDTSSNGAPNYVETGKQFLPILPAPRVSKKEVRLSWFNPGLNCYQKEAIRNVLKGEARPLPYVIFGPPGTGKTVTLVETILQIYSLIPDSRILVATPSNSSANLIAERLLLSKFLCPGDLVRLVAYHCLEEGTVPELLLPYSTSCDISSSRVGDSNPLTYKLKTSSNASVLGRHRITVGTCIALGQLYTMGFPSGHFTHVCVDEAGQATEPELLIPLGFLHNDWGQAILAGDPLQLGPVVNSRTGLHYGLGYSYLARILHSCPYQQDPGSFSSSGGYNPKLVTRLVMNYRSLPEILDLPSSLFYDSQLQPQIQYTDLEGSVLKSLAAYLPKRDSSLPPSIVFHGIRGVNFQDSDCPSWFNPQELMQVIYYLKDFFDAGLTPDDIGVITPYQKQVQKLRSLLVQLELPSPKIGSVEEFQGQERLVILLSTVRSTSKFVKQDLRYSLGFVASPQRLNVALTRARSLLIIIGNPHLLSRDAYWKRTLAYCIDHNSYVGCDIPTEFIDFSCARSPDSDLKELS